MIFIGNGDLKRLSDLSLWIPVQIQSFGILKRITVIIHIEIPFVHKGSLNDLICIVDQLASLNRLLLL